MTRPPIGFSTGCFFKTKKSPREILEGLRAQGVQATELHMNPGFDEVSGEDLAGFSYVSVHAPKHAYQEDAATRELLSRLEAMHAKRPLDLVLFHPDVILEPAALAGLPFPIGFENMDSRKPMGQRAEDLQPLFERFPEAKFVLDVNHILTNDPSMALAAQWHERWGERLSQVHISGFSHTGGGEHVPLFETKQAQIVAAAKNARVQYMVESNLESFGDIVCEREYILTTMGE